MNGHLRLATTTVLLVVAVCVAGCDGVSNVRVTGNLMKNGQPFIVSRQTIVTLTFVPDIETPTQRYQVNKFVQETGHYEIELPAGKYRVLSFVMDTEKNQQIPTAPAKVYDLSKSQVLNIDVTP